MKGADVVVEGADPDFEYDIELLERTIAGHKLIRDSGRYIRTPGGARVWAHGIDPWEVLAAIVWPGRELVEATQTRIAGA